MVHHLDIARLDIQGLQAGEPAAWNAFLAECDPLLRAIAAWPKWRLDPHAREEVVQATRVSLAQLLPTLRSPAALPALVRRICALRCIDAVRRRIREQGVFTPWEGTEPAAGTDTEAPAGYDPVREILLAERTAALQGALARLEPACQQTVRAFYLDGLSYAQIAAQQGVAINTIGSRLSRCLGQLRALLAERR
jgi:RNA polymerase sigma-70 factor (ECF subfamily)